MAQYRMRKNPRESSRCAALFASRKRPGGASCAGPDTAYSPSRWLLLPGIENDQPFAGNRLLGYLPNVDGNKGLTGVLCLGIGTPS